MRLQLKGLYQLLNDEELRPETLHDDLTIQFVEIYDMLSKLAKGDFSARLPSNPPHQLLFTMKTMLNQLAEQMQDYVEESHELAIGICEHYETLNRLARDDFTARASESSSNELIAKLGILINKCTDTLTSSISRLKVAEEESKTAYQQLLDVVENLPDATFVIDQEGRIIAWNRALEDLTGVGKEEMLGKSDFSYSVPFYGTKRRLLIDYLETEDDKLLSKQYTNIRRSHNSLSGEASITPKSPDNLRHVWVAATALFDKQGKRAGGIESIRDVTDLKRSEEEKNLLEAQLFHSKQMEALMLKLGHDLKTPLTPLFTLLPLVRDQVPPEMQRMVDICSTSARHIMNLCESAINLASLSPGDDNAPLRNIELKASIETICDELEDELVTKQMRCEVKVPSGTTIWAVEEQFRILLVNLLKNSIKASPPGSAITIAARRQARMVAVTVSDRGIGLEPGATEKIFEEFYKVDNARRDVSSSGLGLSICKRIVHNHGGSIRAQSKGLGCGTAVVFTMPEGRSLHTTKLR